LRQRRTPLRSGLFGQRERAFLATADAGEDDHACCKAACDAYNAMKIKHDMILLALYLYD
jgi:hypothetical protein